MSLPRTLGLIATCTLATSGCGLPLLQSGGDVRPDSVFVSTPHKPVGMSQRNTALARCVEAMQAHWPRQARLTLNSRGYLRERGDGTYLAAGGYLWQNGERAYVEHECPLGLDTEQTKLALKVTGPSNRVIAGS